jgi:hypothetical protein
MTLKKLIPLMGGVFISLFLRVSAYAVWPVKEVPIDRAGTAITVSISTSAWTQANTSTSYLQNRSAIRVTNPTSNTAVMYGICKETTPTEAITVKINEIAKGSNMTIPCGPGMNLYLLSGHTGAESAAVWEVGQ